MMSDLNNNPPSRKPENDSLLPLAVEEINRRHQAEELARLESVRLAELQDVAAQEKLRGDLAAQIALQEMQLRQMAENSAIDSRIMANQAGFQAAQLETERTVLRENLVSERKASSNMAFGLTLIAGIGLMALIGFGIWYATGSNLESHVAVATPVLATQTASLPADGRTAIVTTPLPSKPVHYTENDARNRAVAHHAKAVAATHKPASTNAKASSAAASNVLAHPDAIKDKANTEDETEDDSDGMDDSASDTTAPNPKSDTASNSSNE